MISREEVEGLAKLARLELDGEEIASLQHDISHILEYVGQISAIEISEADKMLPPLHNVMREDAVRSEGDQLAGKEGALREAFPQEKGVFNVVRAILQKDE